MWGRNKSPEIKKISLPQKLAVRIIDNAKTALHSEPLLTTPLKKLENFERSLNFQIYIFKTGSLEYLPSYALVRYGITCHLTKKEVPR